MDATSTRSRPRSSAIFKRCLRGHDSELFVVVVDDANLLRPDSVVHPYVFIDGLDLLKQLPHRDKR